MNQSTEPNYAWKWSVLLLAAACLTHTGCKKSETGSGGSNGGSQSKTVIQNVGSDTMVNLAIAWADAYTKVDPTVSVEVNGGGSGQGVAALINDACQIANCSRQFEEKEI